MDSSVWLFLAPLWGVILFVGVGFTMFNQRSDRWFRRLKVLNVWELLVVLLAGVAISYIGYFSFRDSLFQSWEFLNGEVVSKQRVTVPCTHCRTICDAQAYDSETGQMKCIASHTECDHFQDYDWVVETNYNFDGAGLIKFNRVDAQGIVEPPGFSEVVVGESATSLHRFDSYIKPAGEMDEFPIDQEMSALYGDLVPPHTTQLAYHPLHAVKVLAVGFDQLPAGFVSSTVNKHVVATDWQFNEALEDVNREIGPVQQANLQFFLVYSEEIPKTEFADLAMGVWRGGGKNDINVFIGTTNRLKPTWVKVTLGATDQGNEMFVAKLEAALAGLESLEDHTVLLDTAQQLIESDFSRKEMADFADRAAGVHPTTGQLVALYMVTLLVVLGLFWAFYHFDPFGVDN